MSAAAQTPAWAVFTVAVATPVLAFVGAMMGHLVARRSAKELEARSRREQLMKTLHWAAELAISEDQAKARLGLRELQALSESELSTPEVHAFIDAALEAVVAPVADELENHPEAEIEPVAPVRNAGTVADSGSAADPPPAIESGQQSEEGGGFG